MMTMKRLVASVACVVTLALLTVACGDEEMSVPDGKKAAQQSRRPVAEAYWQVYQSIGAKMMQGSRGIGRFGECSGSDGKASVRYQINNSLFDENSNEPGTQFVARLRAKLANSKWKLEPKGENLYAKKIGGAQVKFQLLHQPSGHSAIVALLFGSGCISVGKAKSEILDAYKGQASDEYDFSDASAAPIPSGFPESDN
ncbi:hypothetical protein [Streptomyces sp. NBC_00474]|uniref:hypothetical protein n=1 Tax=Streptomyces sp. NBC_00474 TaxID=2975754 RepID=UPI00224DEF28|nr:hypothetical protein [Streptomyces sp. NBC_00474]MCX5050281.1 hypothetical protein [Streptomyces sp. NBC_00474]